MAIITLAQAIAGQRPSAYFVKSGPVGQNEPRFTTNWYFTGTIPAATVTASLDGAALTGPVTGQIPFPEPQGGESAYLSYLGSGNANSSGGFTAISYFCDRLWQNGNIDVTSTSPQGITSPTWPARDHDAATAGRGVFIAAEIQTTLGAATPTITIEYTNSAGGGTKVGTVIIPQPSGAVAGQFLPFSIEAGDVGVQSVQSVTLSASAISGAIGLSAYRVLACMPTDRHSADHSLDFLAGCLPLLHPGSVPFIVHLHSDSSNFANPTTCEVAFTHG